MPSAVRRPPARASLSTISARSPTASLSSARRASSERARRTAWAARSSSRSSMPEPAVWPIAYASWIVRRTAGMRSSTATSSGRPMSVPDPAMRFLARVRRAAIVGSDTRNAAATEAVRTPQPRRIVSATWVSTSSAGWQHSTTRRSSSSSTGGASIAASAGSAVRWPVAAIRATRSRNRASRRMRSMARRRAAVSSQASTESGTPRSGQVCRARANASAVASSAMSRSRAMRIVAPSTRPQYCRWASAAASAGAVVRHPGWRTPRSGGPRCSRTGPGSARRSGGRGRRRRPRSGSSRRAPP